MKTAENSTEGRTEIIHVTTTLTAGSNQRILATSRGHDMVIGFRKKWGGDDAGPTPPEYLAMALGGCVFNICRIMATEQQLELKDLHISVSGDVDPSRAFGFDTNVRAGFSHLSIQVQFSSGLSQSAKEEFRQELLKRCPLCDTISNPTPLQLSFA